MPRCHAGTSSQLYLKFKINLHTQNAAGVSHSGGTPAKDSSRSSPEGALIIDQQAWSVKPVLTAVRKVPTLPPDHSPATDWDPPWAILRIGTWVIDWVGLG